MVDHHEDKPSGIAAFKAERGRQIAEEGYTLTHDLQHGPSTLARAGLAYCTVAWAQIDHPAWRDSLPPVPDYFPEGWEWKPANNPQRNLEKGAALLAAAYDVLQAEGA